MDGVAVVVDSGHGDVVSAKYRAVNAGDGAKVVAVREVIEVRED